MYIFVLMKKSVYILFALLAVAACRQRGGGGDNVVDQSDSTGVQAISIPMDNDGEETEVFEPGEGIVQTGEPVVMPTIPAATSNSAVKVEDKVEFDKTVHDFGDILTTDGPLRCSFSVKNISDEPIAIFEVVTSCGCTEAQWTREPLQPGKSGTISATYSNEDGPYPFDKTLTVYISGLSKPVLLRLRGVVHEKAVPLAELYGDGRIGDLGLKERLIKAGNMEQGGSRTEEVRVANLGKKPLLVDFQDLSPQLSVGIDPNPIPAGQVAVMHFTVKADRSLWGRNEYYGTPVLNGKAASQKIAWWAITKESFSSWTDEQRQNASQPIFDEGTAIFDVVDKGTVVSATYNYTNRGKSTFHVYKLDADAPGVSVVEMEDTEAGEKGKICVSLDTSKLPEGDATIMLTLITNSPLRPLVNLFLAGVVK